MQKGGCQPPIETTIGFSNALGSSSKEITRLKASATGGMYLAAAFQKRANKGMAKAKPKGTAIRSTGFTISAPLFYEG
jgi:hypothetical protein